MELGAPVASSDPFIHLDGFLSYAAGIESIGWDGIQELDPSDSPDYFEDEMPLEKVEINGEWVWAATCAQIAGTDNPNNGKWNITRWRKRFDDDPLHSVKDTQINITTGQFKSYNAALPYNGARKLIFFFEGDAEQVEYLLDEHIPAIGKKTSQGYGRIKDFDITETQLDSCIYMLGHVMRSLPAAFTDGTPKGVRFERRTVRPPYWHAENQSMAYPPFSKVGFDNLRDEVVRH